MVSCMLTRRPSRTPLNWQACGMQLNASAHQATRSTPRLCVHMTFPQAVKNAAELAGMKEAHLRDAVALCQFLHFMETQVGVVDA